MGGARTVLMLWRTSSGRQACVLYFFKSQFKIYKGFHASWFISLSLPETLKKLSGFLNVSSYGNIKLDRSGVPTVSYKPQSSSIIWMTKNRCGAKFHILTNLKLCTRLSRVFFFFSLTSPFYWALVWRHLKVSFFSAQ